MASDLSSGCNEAIGVLDEKEEGEISLEDVSSSEEGHLNYGYGVRVAQCTNCLSTQHNAAWCTTPVKFYHSKASNTREVNLVLQDAVQGKENRHQINESGCAGTKHTVSTLQEKNDDLVPISSDSDMEIVGLADKSKQILIRSLSKSRVKSKRKKKRVHTSMLSVEDFVSSSTIDVSVSASVSTVKHDATKNNSRPYHREMSPVHRSGRSNPTLRSPPRRHRSLIRAHSPFKRSKSPLVHGRSPTIRRSPRRVKSPKRSPYRSPGKSMPRKPSHVELASSSQNYIDTHKLLKKVRRLDSVGTHSLKETLNKNKEHASSLKEKLMNMMKGVGDNNSELPNSSREKSIIHVNKAELNDADDEEDLALLRQKALETKQKKSIKQNDQPKTEIEKKVIANIDDDQDKEDLELRMIALRSAVLKKHQNRVQKGMKSGKYKKSKGSRSESPFTQSFLDSIPIPGEELLIFASPPHTPLPVSENNHTEDMELDTDVEREKEKLPYSPTDKIIANIPMDTELLGIQPSDVSFINLKANNNPSFNPSITSSQDEQKSYQGKIIENRSYLPNLVYCTPQTALYTAPDASVPYSPTDPTKTPKLEFAKVHNSNVNVHHYEHTSNVLKNNNNSSFVDINSSQEMPYSPTDTPVYDPDLSHALPQAIGPIVISNSSLVSMGSSFSSNTHENSERYVPVATKQTRNSSEDENPDKVETLSMDVAIGSAATSVRESVSPSSSMITIDDLPETDADASPLADSLKNVKITEGIPNNLTENGKETISEPLYMKGISDVTKDVNKIPTLINRTLVPAPLLKTNKQLQQPLPSKKFVIQQEPAFKSAVMQSVLINDEISTKTNTSFKPMKLMSFPQKSHSVLTIPTVFHDSSHEDMANVTPTNADILLAESNGNATVVQNNGIMHETSSDKVCDSISPTQKKKKLLKKGLKRRSTGSVQFVTNDDITGTNNDNINIVNKQIGKTAEFVDKDDKQANKELEVCKNNKKQPDTKNNMNASNSEVPQNIINQKDQISSEKNEDQAQSKDISSNDTVEKVRNADDRRQSLDEDEEALRAILLASLPKRVKAISSNLNPNTAPTTSTVLTVASSAINTVNTTNSNKITILPTPPTKFYGSENDKNQPNSGEQVRNVITQESVPIAAVKTLTPIPSGRKRSVPMIKGPQKKLMKRVAIPASTKVVNNAKKYQNAMVQRKLNLQRAALYSKQRMGDSRIIPKLQPNSNKWCANTKILLSGTQRIIINVESDTESDSESESQKKKAVGPANSVTLEKQQAPINSTSEFESNLDQFLRAVRKKQESMAAARPTSVLQTQKKDAALMAKPENSNPSNLHTPLAVRHLPASQQEEYRRLKQQIIEREKLKLHRTVQTNNLVKSKTVEQSAKSVLSKSPNKENPPKINQTVSAKSQSAHAQQLNKENYSKNLDSIKNTTVLHTNNVPLCANTVHNVDKQENTSSNQTKPISRTMTNLNIRISNESNPNNIASKPVANPLQSVTTPRQVFELPANESPARLGFPTGLKVLSMDEVNRKCVQIQLNNNANERLVRINDQVTLNNKSVINGNENISATKDTINKATRDPDISQFVQSVEKEITTNNTRLDNNDVVDSDASTIILNQNAERRKSLDTSESTIRLSQCEEDSRVLSISNMQSKEESHYSLFKSNISDDKRSIEKNWNAIKRDVKTELNALINLPRPEQEQHLADTEQNLVLKRYTILDELAEMLGNIRQWHMERDLQTSLVAEVKKLREQLKVAEERLQLQRNRINSIGPKVVVAHGKINTGRQECFRLATICSTLGSRIIGNDYKVPEAGAQLLDCKMKEVANHTRQLSRKKVPFIDIPDTHESTKLEEIVCTEISQPESLLLEESNVDSFNTTILNENECLAVPDSTDSNVTVDLRETSKEDANSTANNSSVRINEESISEENNTEKEVCTEHLPLSSTPGTTPSVPVSKDSRDSDQKGSLDDKAARIESSLESRNQIRRQTKKTIPPYESILTYFRVPRNANPNGVLCPYELMGTCSDGDCQFIHQRESSQVAFSD
ncbi:uncharacterized protein LOC143373442 isoform X2 [Andrena cerasifolii]|uniref:uncharacterized protein LOC143373442 isoform X2 n=1 Tax=Andrena cerasifolii TaxID=2819439 RepID=UPI004037BA5A